ncbi:hypothetical protein [Sphaerochaeta globosa]|uniref:Lipoprotein n=1 Tax=Sphaerochaeta globosa (strain ATCC BAA-1886 / DSM 22777 / Buddy) TaxID=158189 RepID=F0RRQ3_SPHGB|nr:hypothetical protein [Sphaerochaeta globosa]ADY14312.1 hypothetical protein SpiBuddy_2499 [Sphaerochaeta globosa str. Buddy]
MKRLLFSLVLSILLISCSLFPDQRIAFTFTNALGSTIQTVSVYPIHNSELAASSSTLACSQTKTLQLNLKKATKSDSCYVVAIEHEGITTSVEYGYYSNGFPLEKQVSIVIDSEFLDAGK